MTGSNWTSCLLSIFFLGSWTKFAATETNGVLKTTLKIRVKVLDWAGLPPGLLERAEKRASEMFQDVGIDSEWFNCPIRSTEQLPVCQESGPTDIFLRILPGAAATRGGFHKTTLGFALPSPEGGIYATVFQKKADELARTGFVSEMQVIGCGMVHEIGHLLLGSNSHSSEGLMRANWTEQDLKKLARERLGFQKKEAETMRTEVARRLRRAVSSQSAASGPAH